MILGAALVLAIFLFAITRGLGDDDIPDDAFAVVEGDAISTEEFDRVFGQAALRQGLREPPSPGDEQYELIRDAAQGELLDAQWIQREADERGIEVSDREVEEELEQTISQGFRGPEAFQRFLQRSGFTEEDVDLRIRLQLLSTQIQEQVTEATEEVSTAEAEDYYEANKSDFGQPEQRDVRLVLNRDRTRVEEALSRLEEDDSTANWKRVASELSTDPSSRRAGGLRRSITPALLEEELDEAVFDASEGELVGPVETPLGFYVFQVQSITPAETQPFEEVLPQLQEQLRGQRQQEDFQSFLEDYREKWISRTVCSEDFLNERCENFEGSPPQECTDEQLAQSGCAPPVQSTSPVAPGSILPFTSPSGVPQGPHPPGEQPAAPTFPGGLPGATPGVPPGVTPPGAPPGG